MYKCLDLVTVVTKLGLRNGTKAFWRELKLLIVMMASFSVTKCTPAACVQMFRLGYCGN